jgi:dienelactone hydrolase
MSYSLPSALARQTRFVRLGPTDVPALLAHPDWSTPAPVMIWMHGRTADKTLDNGRYLRWIRAGIAACAIDLPGHGERMDVECHAPDKINRVIEGVLGEIDHVVEALRHSALGGVFDTDRMGLGGMSAGGVATLRRLCDPHDFRCAAVESTAGDLAALYRLPGWPRPKPEEVEHLDPLRHAEGWRPIPLLALHSEADRLVPLSCLTPLIDRLRDRYARLAAPEDWLRVKTWPFTGAPDEHSGFGKVASEAKTIQTDFLARWLGAPPPPPPPPPPRTPSPTAH